MLINEILHITTRNQWTAARRAGAYRGDTLDSEGFIHCSTRYQVVAVADARFAGRTGLVLLDIDPDAVRAEIRYEAAANGELYPHIYGPLNPDAVRAVLPLKPGRDGHFRLPRQLTEAGPETDEGTNA
jgi:uncharacterized protein (DUF952 family)